MSWQEYVKLRYGLNDAYLDWVKLAFVQVLKNAVLKPCVGKSIEPENVPFCEALESLLEEFWVSGRIDLAAGSNEFKQMDSLPNDS